MASPLRGRWAARWVALVLSCAAGSLLLVSAAQADPTPYAPPEGIHTEPPPPAEPAECAPAPEPLPEPTPEEEEAEGYEPLDPAVVELHALRIEAAEACEAQVVRSDRQLQRLWWIVAQLVELESQTAALEAQGSAAAAARAELVEAIEVLQERSDCGDPCRVSFEAAGTLPVVDSAGEQYSDQLVSAVDASGEASKAGLWFLGAVALIGLLAYPIYQVFIFWRRDV